MSNHPPILLMPQGSAGDVHPFVGIGLEMQRRGHHVTLATNGYFSELAERVGLPFVQIGTAEQFNEVAKNPDLWKPSIKSTRVVFGVSAQVVPDQYALIQSLHEQDERLIVVAGPLAFGARIAAEKLGVKHVTIQLAPAVFLSAVDPPRMPGVVLPTWLPLWIRKSVWNLAMSMVDRIACPDVNAFRSQVGLTKPMRQIIRWMNSDQLTVGMFPEWFAKPASDWPSSVRLSSFGLYDERTDQTLPPEVQSFLNRGDKPVVFTPGSANCHGKAFFVESVKACQLSGRRGILLSRYPETIPDKLPDTVKHFEFVPLSLLLPHCSALVYHGGIGTLSQACKAGVPHLVMKLSHDQFDNAYRLEQLGVGQSCKPSGYKAGRVARMLDALILSPKVKQRCEQIRDQMRAEDGVGATCGLIEKMHANVETSDQI
ncbi:MAG: glycosyl transferase [Phycisphaeraceae bacterium]|nr:glycosyl transferase [Phycisphaeraceae bacterium]